MLKSEKRSGNGIGCCNNDFEACNGRSDIRCAPWRKCCRSGRRIFVGGPLCLGSSLRRCDGSVRFWAAVAEELPGVADFADQVEIKIGDDDIVGVASAGGD